MEKIILVICIVALLFCVIAIVKNMNTFYCHNEIGKAIYKYKIACIKGCNWDALHLVEYIDMEDYDKTFLRFWDWGYTRILPQDKFEIIKPHIK